MDLEELEAVLDLMERLTALEAEVAALAVEVITAR